MALTVEVAVAAPLWSALTYSVPADLAPLIRPFTRLAVPVRGGRRLGFALGRPCPGDAAGLKAISDVLDDLGDPPVWPEGMLGFFRRAAAHYLAPLGQALAGALPAGMGSTRGKAVPLAAPPAASQKVLTAREGDPARLPRPDTQAAQLLRRLQRQGPTALEDLRQAFPRAAALAKRLEAAGWVGITRRPVVRDLLGNPLFPEPRPERLTEDQEAALAQVAPAVAAGEFRPFLLHGVTGSGKTELYLAAVEAALAAGRQALILTPEIGLCLRLEGLVKSRLGAEGVGVLHSGLTPAQRRGQWRAIAAGQAPVVLGARSAVFAPLANPGVICVDEEQDEAYKDSERLRYSARDLALLRGQEQSCPVILGSATPSVVSWHRAQAGELTLLSLPRRVKEARMPAMEVVDLRSAGKLAGGVFSQRLLKALQETVAQGRQAIVFLNRRGFAPALICPSCGNRLGCPSCSVSLTWHQARGRMICHVCGHERPEPKTCPTCNAPGEGLKPLGLGTEGVAAALGELAPELRVARLDSDTAADPGALREVLTQVAQHQADVVVGTQMITKGHHFPLIALVGVLMADQALAIPDFRAAERAYSLITQVAGRAGREEGPSRVIVQAYDPAHPALTAALAQDPQAFYGAELAERQALGYPPFMRLAGVRVEGPDEARVQRAARGLRGVLMEARARVAPRSQVLGPAPAPLLKAAGRYRYLLLVKAPSAAGVGALVTQAVLQGPPPPAGIRFLVDIDPLTLV